ncbi:MAG: hypothetical protein Q9164_007189, partial [Protoblastenia rupestris]
GNGHGGGGGDDGGVSHGDDGGDGGHHSGGGGSINGDGQGGGDGSHHGGDDGDGTDNDGGDGHGGGGGGSGNGGGEGDNDRDGSKEGGRGGNGDTTSHSGGQDGEQEGGSDSGRESHSGDGTSGDGGSGDDQSINDSSRGDSDSDDEGDTGSVNEDDDGSGSSAHGLGKSVKYAASSDDEDGDSGAGDVYTTTIDGHKVVVTPTPSRNGKGRPNSGSDQEVYTTTIDSHEVVVTPNPSRNGKGRKNSDSDEEVVVASVKGESRLTTLTLPRDPARASQTGENSAKARPGKSQESHDSDDPTHRTFKTYTESDKPLTLVESAANYFHGIYLPVLLAVAFQMIAGYLYTATKMMEPFAMLSKSNEGIPVKDFLWINYLSANDSLEPFTAMASGHWLMLWVSVLYTLAQVLSPLSSEMLGIYPGYKKVTEDTVDAGAFIWFLLRRYQSKIYSDPSSIAGAGSLINHPDTSRIFSSIGLSTSKDEILEKLAGSRWRLGWYPTESTERYGIIASLPSHLKDPSSFFSPSAPSTPRERSPPWQHQDVHPSATESANLLTSTPYRSKLRTQLILNSLFAALLSVLFSVVLAYQISTTSTGFRRFMNADKFGPRFLLTTAGILLKGQWVRLERRSVVAAPFERAARGVNSTDGDDPKIQLHNDAVLAPRTLIPVTTLFTFFWRPRLDMLATALLALTALAAEALVIIIPGVPFDSGQTETASR